MRIISRELLLGWVVLTVGCGANSGGQATPPTVPSVVTAIGGNAQASVSWTAPSTSGGSAITSYTVTSLPGGLTATVSAPATAATVTSLSNGTSYTFTVVATNALGASAPSSPSNAVTPATVPNAPTAVTATGGNAQASVSWTAPSNNGGSAITSYAVTSLPGGLTATVSAPATTATVTGLSNGTSYTFTVVATNSVGNSVASSPSNAVTPASPAADVAVDVDNNKLYKLKGADGKIIWGPVARANCGGIAVDQVDFGVYTGATANCAGGSGVYKFDATGALAWNTAYAACGTAGAYYIGNGGIAVDTTSVNPGVILTMTGYYGNYGKVRRTDGVALWCNGTNDLSRPVIDPATGQSYAVTTGSPNYMTIYSNTGAGTQTQAGSCDGNLELNPADGALYRGGAKCGTTLYQMNRATLGATNWTMSLSASISSFDSLAVQPWIGGYIYAGSAASLKIAVIDPATRTVVRTFSTAVAPGYLAVDLVSGNLYITSGGDHFVYAYSPTGILVWKSPDLGGLAYSVATARN
jgi:hypothetical protein